jgi:hypothetical protein
VIGAGCQNRAAPTEFTAAMRKLSSESTTVAAKTFPILPGAVLVLMLCAATYDCFFRGGTPIAPLVVLAALVTCVWLTRTFVWTLMDEVFDGGDCLVVKRGSVEDKLYFVDIQDAIDRSFSRPPKLVLQLRCKSKFGWSIAFVPTTDKDVLQAGMSIGREVRHRCRGAEA